MDNPKVICIIKDKSNTYYLVYDTKKNIELAFGNVNFSELVVSGAANGTVFNKTVYFVNVAIIPTDGVQVIQQDTDNENPSSNKLTLFKIQTNPFDYDNIIKRITSIMANLNTNFKIIEDVVRQIVDRIKIGNETESKNGGKKRYRSSRKSSTSRRRRSTKRRTASRKQQKRRRGSRRAH
jgi:hypothetical protein